jgi:hypothetical protein
MAAGAWNMYTVGVTTIASKLVNLASDSFNVVLSTNSYTPNPNIGGDSTYASLTNEVANGAGYTTGGTNLIGPNLSSGVTTATFSATTSPSWTSFTATLRYASIVHRATSVLVSTDTLVCFSDLTGGGSITGAGGTFTITLNASGIFTITHNP